MNLASLDLNLLLVLHAALAERSATGAARRLNLTQSAVSNALRRARALLGDPLLVRAGRGLVPTPRALEIAPRLEAALAGIEEALGGRVFDPGRSTRRFTLACSDAEAVALLPRLAPAFAARMPQAGLRVVSLDYLVAAGGLAAPDVDAAVGPALAAPEGARAETLYVEDVVLAVRQGHPLAQGAITAARLSAAAWVDTLILLGAEGVGHGMTLKALAEHGVKRRVALAVPTFTLAALTATRTDLVAGLPRRVAEALAADLALAILELPFPLPGMPLALLWHLRTDHDEGARRFRGLITEAARGLGGPRGRRPARRAGRRDRL